MHSTRVLRLGIAVLAGAAIGPAGAQTTLRPGDLMFSTWNANQDGWALIALVDLAPSTNVYFSNDAWRAGGGYAPGGGFERWDSGPIKITAGSVIRFTNIDSPTALAASSGSLARVVVPGSSYLNLSQTGGTLYAYQGQSATQPSVFVTAISNGGFEPSIGSLGGTGLSAGVNAVRLVEGADFAEFTASRTLSLSADAYRSQLAATDAWSALNGVVYGATMPNAAPLSGLVVSEPNGLLLLLAGISTLSAARAASGPLRSGVRRAHIVR